MPLLTELESLLMRLDYKYVAPMGLRICHRSSCYHKL